MAADSQTRSGSIRVSPTGPWLLGLRPVVRKEIHEWLASRRAWLLLIVTSLMMVLTTLGPRLAVLSAGVRPGQPRPPVSLDPTVSVLAKWDQWLFFFAIVFSASLLVGERDRGTLAWSLSKPLSRSALLVGKWAGAMAVYLPFGLALPMALCVVVSTVAYGTPDLGRVIVGTILLGAMPAFFIALTLALGTVLPSQAAVGGVAAIVAITPGLIGALAPDVAAVLPPSMGPWAIGYALGAPVPVGTPIGWLVGLVVVAGVAIAAIRRLDF